MKVLLAHNLYRSDFYSGEDIVFNNELELLRRGGIKTITYTRHNNELQKTNILARAKAALENIYSIKTYKEIKSLIKREKPDIVHVHNIFYLISSSIYYACRDMGIPVVQTLHNYRKLCLNASFYCGGKACEDCLGKISAKGIFRKCYKGSFFYSLPIALSQICHKALGTWDNMIDAYIALTETSKKMFVRGGLPERKIFVKPNFLYCPMKPKFQYEDYAVFVGRDTAEKGFYTLQKAWGRVKSYKLKMIGGIKSGEKAGNRNSNKNIEFLGQMSNEHVLRVMSSSSFIIVPSECYETFSLAVIEGYACGKPVIGSRIGSLEEIIKDNVTGIFFESGSEEDLLEKISWMIENRKFVEFMDIMARNEYENKYTPEKNYGLLMEVYKKAISK